MTHKHQNKKSGIWFFSLTILLCGILIFKPALAEDASLLPNAVQQYFDSAGNPLASGKIYFYEVGTSTFKNVYTSSAASTPYTNPITLNAGGKPPGSSGIYGIGLYRQLVKDKNNNIIWDAVTAPGGGGSTPTNVGDGNLVGTVLPWSSLVAPNQYVFAYGQEITRATYPEFFTAITQQANVICSSASNTLTGLSDTTQINIGSPIELALCVISGTTVVSKTSSTVTLSNPSSVSINAIATFFPYGNGNGTTTFNTPDLRGYVIAGRNNMGGTASSRLTTTYFVGGDDPNSLGGTGGSQSATLTQAQLPVALGAATSNSVVTDPGHSHLLLKNINAGTATPPTSTNYAAGSNSLGTSFDVVIGGTASVADIALSKSSTTGVTVATTTTITNASGGNPTSIVQPTITLNYVVKISPDTSTSIATGVYSIGGMTGVIACGTGLLCTGNIISVNNIAAGGSDTNVQFNSGGVLSGSNNFNFISPDNLTLGAAGVTGKFDIFGSTSGRIRQTAPAVAGTTNIVWGNASGTPAVTASAPIVLNSTTGNLTCSTCVTGVSGALTINTTPVSGATVGQILYSDGSLLQAGGAVKTTSLALGGATIGTNALAVTGTASVSGSITTTAGNFIGNTSGGYLYVAGIGRSALTSLADGNFTLSNAAGNLFGLLQFGGGTSGFPAIKRSGAALNFRLADDSADAAIVAAAGSFSDNVNIAAGKYYTFGASRSQITSPADGVLLLQDSTISTFGRLQFGGTTASFPALARNSTGLRVRLADDSANADLTANSLVATGNSYSNFATAIPAGGSTGSGFNFSSTSNFGTFFGSGAPTLSAAQGSLYLRSDGTPYYNTNGTTGWAVIGGSSVAITSLTGDVTGTGPGATATTLATVNSNVGSFGSSTSIPSFTVNGKGLITAASGNVVIAPAGTLSGTTLNSTVVTSSLTSVGTLTGGATGSGFTIALGSSTITGSLALTNGGAGGSLTASNGGIVYSDASRLQILSGTVTAGQCLLSGSSAAPTWGSCSGGGAAVSSVAAGDTTLTISPTTGAVIAQINLANANAWTAAQTIQSTSATSFAVGRNGSTNPTFLIDDATASSATGIKIKSAAAAAGVAVSVITSGTNENLTIDAAGSGTITFGGTSTGSIIHTRATTLSAALTYGGVTLSNAVTGTGNMVLSASPTFSGTVGGAGTIPLSVLATQTADTVVANASGSTASPTAVSIGSCSAASSALTYNTTTHAFGCNTISAAGLSSKTSSITRDPSAANGNVATTGVGFLPTSCSFSAQGQDASGRFWISSGSVDSSKAGRAQALGVNGGAGTSTSIAGAKAIYITDTATPGTIGTTNDAATVNSFDADGFTLAWLKTNSPASDTITINYTCNK